MKKIVITLLLIILFSSFVYASDFRNIEFGMNIDEVKNNETSILLNEYNDKLVYEDKIMDNKVRVNYYFKENKLIKCAIDFVDINSKDNSAKEEYLLRKKLNKKYGNGNSKDIWEDGKDITNYLSFDKAIKYGGYITKSTWNKDELDIILFLRGNNGKAKMTLEYKLKDNEEKGNIEDSI